MKKFFLCLIVVISLGNANAQLAPELNHPVVKYKASSWNAFWISCPGAPEADYNVSLFRHSFNLANVPDSFIVHVSADNRYKLYVNGKLAGIGPQLSDNRHWRYETIDLASYLKKGRNVIAAEVANWGADRFYGIMSLRTGFIMQGYSKKEAMVNTSSEWKAYENKAYSPLHPNWVQAVDIVGGFYASNPGDSIQLSAYPQDWNLPDYSDRHWKTANWIWRASNENENGHYWLMKPRSTPQVVQNVERFGRIARDEGLSIDPAFLTGKKPITIPANSKVTVLFDFLQVALGYPELLFSGGAGGKITIRYAENLLKPDLSKGDRNDVTNKQIRGIRDVIIPDGRSEFLFSPLWYRGFRYVQITFETASHPLVVLDFYNKTTVAPVERKAFFESDNPIYKRIDNICWYTAKICTQDNLMSDAYYEQMMYVGDTKVHALVNQYMTGDDIWLRNAIDQFSYSQLPNGLLNGCYPVRAYFYYVNFSLAWIDMIHDFMMHSNDQAFVKSHANGIRQVLQWFNENKQENGLIARNYGRFFIDWYNDGAFAGKGVSPGSQDGNSAAITLQYAASLRRAAEIFNYLDMKEDAAICRSRAEKIKADVIKACWDENRGLFAENPDKKFFDERANILAMDAEVFDIGKQRQLFLRCLNDTSISKPGYYFRYRNFEQMRKLGMGEHFDRVLDIWKALLPLNLTTTPERLARQRSDAHPWSAIPSVAFLSVVAGIAPAEPEFRSVNIEPALGNLKFIDASYPHYLGDIRVKLKKTDGGGIEGSVELPPKLTGTFRYRNHVLNIKEGVQKIAF